MYARSLSRPGHPCWQQIRSFVRCQQNLPCYSTLGQHRWSSTSSSGEVASAPTSSSPAKEPAKKTEEFIPFLQRPLGVREPPTTTRQTWKERAQELMDYDVRIKQREHLIKEATKGYLHDLHALRKWGGKTWTAPPSLIRAEQALYFPDIAGVSLDTKEKKHTTDMCLNRISVIAMITTQMSIEHAESFVRPTNDQFLPDPRYQYLQINLQENVLKGLLVSLAVSSLRKKIDPALQPTYLLSMQNLEYVKEDLALNNKHIGFVYLVDQNLKIRWAGGGLARPEETESLRKCVSALLNRFRPVKTNA